MANKEPDRENIQIFIQAEFLNPNLYMKVCYLRKNTHPHKQVRDSVRATEQDRLQEHASTLLVQGSFLALAAREKEDIMWNPPCSTPRL